MLIGNNPISSSAMRYFHILYFLPLLVAPLQCKSEVSLLKSSQPEHIVVNNRILAKVNGKAISVVDLMKKMDILFYREFPQYTSIPEARFQFYQANWRHILEELVDKELIIADAEENKLPISAGDVRQEMEHLFGPNIIGNLDKIGMTFDEAWKIIQGDLLLQRMLYIRVNSKAMRQVTPKTVHAYYQEFAKENIQPDQWTYQVITIRDKDSVNGAEVANVAYQMLTSQGINLDEFADKLKNNPIASTSQISVSDLFKHSEKDVSPIYKEVLQGLKANSFSQPVAQKSKDGSTVFRLFFLESSVPGGPPPFKEVEGKLKEKLVGKEIATKGKEYIGKLHKHFDVQEMIPEGFEPFEFK